MSKKKHVSGRSGNPAKAIDLTPNSKLPVSVQAAFIRNLAGEANDPAQLRQLWIAAAGLNREDNSDQEVRDVLDAMLAVSENPATDASIVEAHEVHVVKMTREFSNAVGNYMENSSYFYLRYFGGVAMTFGKTSEAGGEPDLNEDDFNAAMTQAAQGVEAALSPTRILATWNFFEENYPQRVTSDLYRAFLANERTPAGIKDEAEVGLERVSAS